MRGPFHGPAVSAPAPQSTPTSPLGRRERVLLAVLAWWLGRIDRSSNPAGGPKSVPVTDPGYWVTMLTAGVFGTVLGDWCQKAFGENLATAWLIVLLVVALGGYRKFLFGTLAGYWLTVAVARTPGTEEEEAL